MHTLEKKYEKCTAKLEVLICPEARVDVCIYQDYEPIGVVEVYHTHLTQTEGMEIRESKVGSDNVWEITTANILEMKDKDEIEYELESNNSRCLPECTEICHIMKKHHMVSKNRQCVDCEMWGELNFKLKGNYDQEDNIFKNSYACRDCISKWDTSL